MRSKPLLERIEHLENQMSSILTEVKWLTRIVAGAASLGFIEKMIGWFR